MGGDKKLASVLESPAERRDGVTHLVGCKEIIGLIPKAKYRTECGICGNCQSVYYKALLPIRQILKTKFRIPRSINEVKNHVSRVFTNERIGYLIKVWHHLLKVFTNL